MIPYIPFCHLEPGEFCRDCEVESVCARWQSYRIRRNHRRKEFLALILAILAAIATWVSRIQSYPPHSQETGNSSLVLAQGDGVDVWQQYGIEAIPIAPGFYTVKPGEQLFHIAAKYRLPGPVQLTIDVLKEINNLWDRPLLAPGQKLRVPETDPKQWPLAIQKIWAGKSR